jgi:predicted dienelactone hydrolase
MILAWLSACSADPASADPSTLVLPEDPAEPGLPVGVVTEVWAGRTVEIWYPAEPGGEPEAVDFAIGMPDSVTELLGPVVFPEIPTRAVRDAPLRPTEVPYPVVVFSHGLGGTRQQSPDLTTHLASRGYVVVAPDHVGRTLYALAPCLFSPALSGCDFAATLVDGGVDDLPAVADAAEQAATEGWLAGAIDVGRMGLSGHSLGGGSTTRVGEVDDRFDALLPMAGADPVARDVPMLAMAATCDGVIAADQISASVEASTDATLLAIAGAGHLAFSDMCTLRFDQFYADHLADRTDTNELFVDLLVALSADGCAFGAPSDAVCAEGSYLDEARGQEIVRGYATLFFDAWLRDGPAPDDGRYPEATLR